MSSFGRLPSAEEPVRVLAGDALAMLQSLPDGCVQCAITSPPYYGLRDYQLAPQVWGGAGGCEHVWEEPLPHGRRGNRGVSGTGGNLHPTLDHTGQGAGSGGGGQFCRECGAWRGCLGLEPTPDLYIEHMVVIFREMKRVLRKDGTFWLNMGDAYANDSKWGGSGGGPTSKNYTSGLGGCLGQKARRDTGMKDKDLMLMPHRLALALQADGWWVRMDCVWQKPNPMPESCRDRPTRAHEYVFLLTKAAKYYYDPVAVREKAVDRDPRLGAVTGRGRTAYAAVRGGDRDNSGGFPRDGKCRNQRSVWTINARAYAGAHFSTFPPALVEPCLKAGTSARGCCPECGAPWKRVIEKGNLVPTRRQHDRIAYGVVQEESTGMVQATNRARDGHRSNMAFENKTTGWTPTCAHDDPPVPCVVLDPFAGSGTVGAVALAHGRHAVLIELQESYLPLIQARLAAVQTKLEVSE